MRGIVSRIETCFKTRCRHLRCPGMASPVAERAPAGAIDLLDGDLYAGDPDPTYAWLRRRAPVYRDEVNDVWGISRYHDIVDIEKNPVRYTSSEGSRPRIVGDVSSINNDDPLHQNKRRLVARRFTPRSVKQHEDRAAAREDRGRVDRNDHRRTHVDRDHLADVGGINAFSV